MESLKGQLLLSGGGLYDPNFRHSVVLVGEHDADGAVGVVLTRPLEAMVADVVPLLGELVEPGELLFEGGPVQPNRAVLMAEVSRPDLLDVTVFGSVGFLTGDVSEEVRPYIRRVRVFLGHAGWGPDQLEAELEEESWIVEENPRADDVFTPLPEALWGEILRRKGPPYSTLARVPFDPKTN